MINLPLLKIGNLEFNLIQGGMGVRISGKNLASAVANCGGAGIIATVGLGQSRKEHYPGTYIQANQDALRDEIRAARQMSNGVIGVNAMFALTDFKELIRVSVEEGVDLLIAGAGMPRDLPKLVGDAPISLVPIVSDKRTAELMTRAWRKSNSKVPDAFIVEGPKAGGHLGFKYDDLVNNTAPKLENIAKDVIAFANDPRNFEKPVPVIVAGGIYTGQDIKEAYKWGATGVQMGTRFVTTLECDADDRFKQAYLDATEEDLRIIESPVGLPGRALWNEFLDEAINGKKNDFRCDYGCLKTCKPKQSLYCIAKALINAQKGDLKNGFVFAGANAYRCTPETCLDENGKYIPVSTLMQTISNEFNS